MSEETTNYGIPNTTLDTEPFPPQTGDLLGAYVARLARTVVELDAERKAKSEEPSAYQRSLEARIERLEKALQEQYVSKPAQRLRDLEEWRDLHENWCAHHKADLWKHVETLESKLDEVDANENDAFRILGKHGARMDVIEKRFKEFCKRSIKQREALALRVATLESKLDELDANEDTMFERLNEVQEHVGHWFNNDVENRVVAFEARIERLESLIERLMARMDVLDKNVDDYILFGCDRNSCPLQEPTEEPAVTAGVVKRERTHGRYGTRNLTKSKNVCATCGHAEAYHLNDTDGNPMCRAGTLGKPCMCLEYQPVAGYW